MFFTNEILPKVSSSAKHKLTLNNVKFVKNYYSDTSLINKQRQTNERMVYDENDKYPYCVKIINQVDSSVYAKTRFFNLKTIGEAETIDFYNSAIPQTTINDNYEVEISLKEKIIVSFDNINFGSLLDIKSKKDNLTESRDFKLVSKDKRLIIFLSMTID